MILLQNKLKKESKMTAEKGSLQKSVSVGYFVVQLI